MLTVFLWFQFFFIVSVIVVPSVPFQFFSDLSPSPVSPSRDNYKDSSESDWSPLLDYITGGGVFNSQPAGNANSIPAQLLYSQSPSVPVACKSVRLDQ